MFLHVSVLVFSILGTYNYETDFKHTHTHTTDNGTSEVEQSNILPCKNSIEIYVVE